MKLIVTILIALAVTGCGETPIELIHEGLLSVSENASGAKSEVREYCEEQYVDEADIEACVDEELNNLL